MKKYIINAIVLLFTSGLLAQGIYNNGAKIAVGTGSYLTIGGANGNYRNETSGSNGSIDLSGTLTLSGNVTNNVSVSDVLGTVTTGSSVVLNGTTPQTIGGTTSATYLFPNLTINNSSGVVLAKNVQVNGTMTFNSGLITLGSNNFTFGVSGVVSGTPSSASMIVATGTGQVQKQWTGVGAFTFPIGDYNVTAKYSPVSLNFTSGTFAPGAVVGVNVVNAKYNDPSIMGSYLNRYWNLTQTGVTSFACDAVFQYLPADVTGTESLIKGLRVLPTPFTIYNFANTALQQLNVPGLTSLGTFTGGTGDKLLTLSSVMLEGLYNGLGTMRQAMDEFGPHWPAGVADHITVELHSSTSYATVVYSVADVPLSTTGTANIVIPAIYNGSYYITIKHRNSIETTTATAISFAGSTISQSFGATANVYGTNLGLSIDGYYLIYGGDVNQDGFVDTSDFSLVLNDAFNYVAGYLATDVVGQGIIDSGEFSILVNNGQNYVGTSHP